MVDRAADPHPAALTIRPAPAAHPEKAGRDLSIPPAWFVEWVSAGIGPTPSHRGVAKTTTLSTTSQEYTELVCGMNLELMRGLAGALTSDVLEPHLDLAPGRCCVRLRTRPLTGDQAARTS